MNTTNEQVMVKFMTDGRKAGKPDGLILAEIVKWLGKRLSGAVAVGAYSIAETLRLSKTENDIASEFAKTEYSGSKIITEFSENGSGNINNLHYGEVSPETEN